MRYKDVVKLEIQVDDKQRIIFIWLTRAEHADMKLMTRLEAQYKEYKSAKYCLCVFKSGFCDLHQSTRDLLAHNAKRIAETAVQLEKEGDIR